MVLRHLLSPAQPCNPDQGICFDESRGEMQKLCLRQTGRMLYGIMKSSMVQRPAAVCFKLQFRFTFCSVHQVFSLVLLPLKRLPHVLAVHDVLHEFVCQGVFAVLKLEYGRIVWPKLRIVWPAPILTTKAAMRWTASLLWRLPTTISARCTGEWQCSGLSYGVK